MRREEIERRMREAAWPAPPERLRTRVLALAADGPAPLTWSDRVWYSRAGRLAFAAVGVFVIVAGQWAASRPTAPPHESRVAMAEVEALRDMVRQAGMPADVAAALVRRSLAGWQDTRKADVVDTLTGEGGLR